MGLSASQGRLLLLTARKSDLEYRAQQISQKRLILSQQLEEISLDYEEATSNRQMGITLYLNGAADPDAASTSTKRESNLTYSALISGSIAGYNTSITGIQAYGRTEQYLDGKNSYSSTTAYRLVNSDGAIVVSSLDEIPSEMTQNPKEKAPSRANDSADKVGVYTTINSDGSQTTSLVAPSPSENSEDSDAYKMFKEIFGENASDSAFKNVGYDVTNGIIKYTDSENNTFYYSIKTGSSTNLSDGTTYDFKDTTLYANKNSVPNSKESVPAAVVDKSLNATKGEGSPCIEKGKDGVYTLYDADGAIVNRYVVDPVLLYGSTDIYGSQDGPNYLQDCLRNGKYLIEQLKTDENTDTGYRWSSISWDATANISDSYYTEDDDAAKAKYDRLQNQVQSQDKKLELELDNIETQRSAVTTEIDSVNKVITDNVEKTFNAFG